MMSAWLVVAYDLESGGIVRPSKVDDVHFESGNLIKQSGRTDIQCYML